MRSVAKRIIKSLPSPLRRSISLVLCALRNAPQRVAVGQTPRRKRYSDTLFMRLGSGRSFDSACYFVNVSSIENLERGFHLCIPALFIDAFPWGRSKSAGVQIVTAAKAQGTKIIFLVQEEGEVPEKIIPHVDLFLYQNRDLERYVEEIASGDSEKMLLPLSVDIKKYNPVDWTNDAASKVYVHGQSEELRGCLKGNCAAKKCIFVELSLRDTAGKDEAKAGMAVVVDTAAFASAFACAQRVVTLAAMGSVVIVYGSAFPAQYLGHEVCLRATTPEQLAEKLDAIRQCPVHRERLSIQFRNRAMLHFNETIALERVLPSLELKPKRPELISVILSTVRPEKVERALGVIERQVYPEKELILVLHGDGFDVEKIQTKLMQVNFPVTLLRKEKESLFGSNLSEAASCAQGEYVAKMDDDDEYGDFHLQDIHLAYQYSGASVVGKWGHFVSLTGAKKLIEMHGDRTEKFGTHLPGGTFLLRKRDLLDYGFGDVTRAIDSHLFQRMRADGHRIYSTHQYNYIRVRHTEGHTFQKSEAFFYENRTREREDAGDLDSCKIGY